VARQGVFPPFLPVCAAGYPVSSKRAASAKGYGGKNAGVEQRRAFPASFGGKHPDGGYATLSSPQGGGRAMRFRTRLLLAALSAVLLLPTGLSSPAVAKGFCRGGIQW
jgi:hypothetical protein